MVHCRIVFKFIAIIFGVLPLAASQENPSPSAKKEVTYSRDVAPIVYKNCVTCHRPNDIAPMSLLTYKDTRPGGQVDSRRCGRAQDAAVARRPKCWGFFE